MTEGSPAVFTLTRTGATAQTLDVAYTVTATGAFGAATGAGTATFLANDATVQVSVATTGDSTHEAHGSVTLTLTADTSADPAWVLGDPATATAAVEDDDDSPTTGSVTVTGTATEGETLSADTSGLTDADGLDNAAYTYQWVRTPAGDSDEDISGATSKTYVPVFADADATLKIKVTVTDDEGHEATFTSAPTSAVAALPRPEVTVAAETDTVKEGQDAVFILTRTGVVTDALVVTFAVTGGDAVLSDDPPTEATFDAGATTVRVPLATDTDADVEDPDAKLTLTLTDGDAYDLGTPSAATVTVTDPSGSDAVKPVVTVVAETDTVKEGQDAVFVLTRTGDTAQTLDVAWETTATGDFGVTTGAGTATFPANSATVRVSVATTGDNTHEAHGSVTVTLTADTSADPAWVLGDPSAATAAVEDDDDSPATGAVTVTTATTFTEGETLTADTSGLTDADGLANAAYTYQWVRTPAGGSDADIPGATGATYVPVYADVGATLKVRVTVTDDEGHEASFTSAPTSAVAARARPSVTVVSDGDVTEGSPAVFTLTRTGATAQTLDVAYDVTATGDFGVTPGAGTATFPANSATVRVSVATTGDGAHEAHGSVTLTLTADTAADPAYVLGDPSTATATVRDDDDSPATGAVTVTTATTFTEGATLTADTSGLTDADGLDNADYTYQWIRTPSGGSDADISGATSQTYTPVSTDVGATLKVKVTVTDDEGHDAMFESTPTAAVVAAPTLPRVSVMHGGSPITEGGVATFTFTLSKTIGDIPLRVNIRRTETGNMMFPNNLGRSVVVFGPNQTTVTVSYPTVDDDTTEPNSTVTVEVLERNYYMPGTPSMASVEVRDDDDSPATGSVTVTTATTFTEGETLTADTSAIADEDGLDNAGYAYQWVRTPAGGSDADISGATSQTYVPVFADAGATLKVRVTVTDDEGHQATITSAPTAAVAALPRVSVMHGGSPITEGGVATFTFTLSKTIGDIPLRVNIRRTETGNMMFPNNLGRSVVVFGPNQTTLTVSYPTVDDDTTEPNSTVTVEVLERNYYMPGTPSMASVEVQDDDDSPATGSVTVTGTATEGETLTADTSAIADEDGLDNAAYAYQWVRTPAGGSDADISGATSQTYVPVFADVGATLKVKVTVTDDEGHEATFTSAPTSAVAAARPSVTVAAETGTVTEGTTAVFILTRTGVVTDALAVTFAVTGGEAVLSEDPPTEVTFKASATTVRVTLGTENDDTHEADAAVTLTLTDGDAYDLGTPSAATVTVEDDDVPPPVLSISDAGAREGNSGDTTARFTVTLDRAAAVEVTVDWATADGTATAGTDYTAGEGTLTISSGVLSKTIAVPVTGDDVDEPNETFTVELSNASGASLGEAVGTGTIRDDDDAPTVTLVLTPASITEAAGRSTVTARLDHPSSEETAVTVTVAPKSPAVEGDYTLSTNKTLTIAAGATTSTGAVTITAVNNAVDAPNKAVTVSATAENTQGITAPQDVTLTIRDDENVAPTGAPTIDDTTPVVGETLTADPSGIGDTDGLTGAAFAWRWLRVAPGGAETEAGTGAAYVVVAADVGAVLKVEASFTDDGGAGETLESAETAAVEAAPLPTVSVARVSSPVSEGADAEFLVTREAVTAGALTVRYSVSESGAMVAASEEGAKTVDFGDGETEKTVVVPTVDDSVHEADSTVTFRLDQDAAYEVGAAASGVIVEDDDNAAPTGAVTVDDTTPVVGETLTADASDLGDPDGLTGRSFAWQWIRTSGGTATRIAGATSATYTVAAADVGATLKAEASFTDDDGTEETVESAETDAVVPAVFPSVSVARVSSPVSEGEDAEFRVTRTVVTAGALTVRYGVSESGAMVAASEEGAKTIDFGDGETEKTVAVPTVDDSVHEANSTVTFRLAPDAAYEVGTAASGGDCGGTTTTPRRPVR